MARQGANGSSHKFTGKERDAESGFDYFGARYYSSAMGRWMTPDWGAKPQAIPYSDIQDPQTLNLYSYVRNIPTTRVDADGHFGDFYNDRGQKIGDDGAKDDKQYFVANRDEADQMQRRTTAGEYVPYAVSAIELPGKDVRAAIDDAVKASGKPSGNDRTGGFHEEGGVYGTTAAGQQIAVPSQPGPFSPPGAAVATLTFTPVDQNRANSVVAPQGEYHVHPSGMAAGHAFAQPPSAPDRAATMPGGTNIVVGARDRTVYFYNSSGILGTMSYPVFKRIP